jgi:hypothetical protein
MNPFFSSREKKRKERKKQKDALCLLIVSISDLEDWQLSSKISFLVYPKIDSPNLHEKRMSLLTYIIFGRAYLVRGHWQYAY